METTVELVEDRRRVWAVDWRCVDSVIRSWAHHRAIVESGSVVSEDRTDSLFNDLGEWLPASGTSPVDVVSYEIDWGKVEEREKRWVASTRRHFIDRFERDGPRPLREELTRLVRQKDGYRRTYRRRQREASDRTRRAIESAVAYGEGGVEKAKVLESASAGGLILGATILTGGSALAGFGAAAGGGGLKWHATYRDTGSWEAATLDAAVDVGLAYIPVGKIASAYSKTAAGEFAVVAIFEGKIAITSGLKSGLIQAGLGKSNEKVSNAMAANMMGSLVGSATGAGLSRLPALRGLMDKTALPGVTKRVARREFGDQIASYPGEVLGGLAGETTKSAFGSDGRDVRRARERAAGSRGPGSAADQLAAVPKLVELAVRPVASGGL